MRKAVVLAVVFAWLLLLGVTHYGGRSPYSYGWAIFHLENENSKYLHGAVVNPDALSAVDVSLFFYDGRYVDWGNAPNLDLPLHAFTVGTLAGITRGTLTASYLANLLFFAIVAAAALNLADRHGIRRGVTLVTLLTVFSLPIVLDYIGQPLHYVVGMCGSFLIVLAMLGMDEQDARRPWIAALAVSILPLNYDPYVFLAALLAWLVFVRRFARLWHVPLFLVLAAIPKILWSQFLRWASHGNVGKQLQTSFIQPVIDGWMEMLLKPAENVIQPFVASHTGVHVAIHQIIAMIYWPLVAVCLWLLIRLRPRLSRTWVLAALMPVFLFLEQMAAAAWDWELNPRRAIPAVLAFAIAWCWCADKVWDQRRWRIGIYALFGMSAMLALSDTLLHEPVMAYMRTGQAMRIQPQEAAVKENLRLYPYSMPKLLSDTKIDWRDLEKARIERREYRRTIFMASQAMGLYLLVGLFWLTARARILPRWSPYAAAGVWVVSLVRFI